MSNNRKYFIFYLSRLPRRGTDLKIKRFFLVLTVTVTLLVLVSGCATEQSTTVTSIPAPTSATGVTTESPTNQPAMKNIIDTLETDGRFTSLVTALKAADLNDTLSDPGSTFTVFAPTDDAFKKLPSDTMDTLLKDPEGDLLQILLYHIVSEKMMLADIEKLTTADTLQGGPLQVSISNGTVSIDSANIIITDIECSNGVIFGVDTVMLPPA